MSFILNLMVTSSAQKQVSCFDRSVQFGDAHFTTMKVVEGEIEHLALHIQRLQKAHKRLDFKPVDWPCLAVELKQLALRQAASSMHVFKLVISRGESQRGYAYSDDCLPLAWLTIAPLPAYLQNMQMDDIEIGIAETSLGHQPLLAGIKHNNRLEQVLIKKELASKGLADALVCDIKGNMIETSVANLFFKLSDSHAWCTPRLSLCGIEGIKRQFVIEQMNKANIELNEIDISKTELGNVEAAFMTNALIGCVAINKMGEQVLNRHLALMTIDKCALTPLKSEN